MPRELPGFAVLGLLQAIESTLEWADAGIAHLIPILLRLMGWLGCHKHSEGYQFKPVSLPAVCQFF